MLNRTVVWKFVYCSSFLIRIIMMPAYLSESCFFLLEIHSNFSWFVDAENRNVYKKTIPCWPKPKLRVFIVEVKHFFFTRKNHFCFLCEKISIVCYGANFPLSTILCLAINLDENRKFVQTMSMPIFPTRIYSFSSCERCKCISENGLRFIVVCIRAIEPELCSRSAFHCDYYVHKVDVEQSRALDLHERLRKYFTHSELRGNRF